MSEPMFLTAALGIAGALMGWYILSVNLRLTKHGTQIDKMYGVVKDLAVAMAKDSVGRPEFERRMQRIEQQLLSLAIEFERAKK